MKKIKTFLSKNWLPCVIVFFLVLFIVLTILIRKNTTPSVVKTLGSSITQWSEEVKKDQFVVTVIAGSTCSHCTDYKPTMQKVYNNNDVIVYWFEIDKLTKEGQNTLTSTIELKTFEGGTPHTFISKNGKLIDEQIGRIEEEELKQFLKKNNVIK